MRWWKQAATDEVGGHSLMAGTFRRHLRITAVVIFLIFLLTPMAGISLGQGLEVIPRASFSEGYDDNVTYVKNNSIRDFVTNFLAGAEIKREGKTCSLSIDVNVACQLFAGNTSFNNVAEYIAVRAKKELSKCDQLTLNDSFSHAEEPRSFEDTFGRTGGRYFTYQNYFTMGYRRDLSQQLAWGIRYGNDSKNFSRKDMDDSSVNTVGTGLDYAFDSETVLSPKYDYARQDFSSGHSATENEISVNLRRFLTAQLYIDLQTGVDFIDSYDGQNYTRLLYRAGLTNDIDENTRCVISVEKKFSTTAYAQDLLDSWRVSIKLAKQLTARFQVLLNAFYGNGTYVTTDIKDKFTGVNAGGSYDLTEKIKLKLNYAYSKDDSTQLTNSYTKNTVYAGVSAEF
ncbi:outer membrane beta-barrel protein [bacterium]|nr:outer membrane beta-barrel protein [bacterium]